MSRKDYESIAAAILSERAAIEDRELDSTKLEAYWRVTASMATAIAEALKEGNPRFDVDRFLVACGLELEI